MNKVVFYILPLILLCVTACSQPSPLAANGSAAVSQPDNATVGLAEAVHGDDSSSHGFVVHALRWYDANMNYKAVFALMTVESSFVPFPSEVVVPPAVYVASNPESEGGMKIWLVVIVATFGALVGAFINYYLSRWLGRPIIYKFADSRLGHLLLLNREKIERAERYFNRHGNISTLIGRLVPVIRQLISIPAGLSKMNVGYFALFTFIGAAVWNVILAVIGYLAYKAADPSVIERYSRQFSIAIVAVVALAVLVFIIRFIVKHRKFHVR